MTYEEPTGASVRTCGDCGRTLQEDELYCAGCGHQLAETSRPKGKFVECPECGKKNPGELSVCQWCHKKMVWNQADSAIEPKTTTVTAVADPGQTPSMLRRVGIVISVVALLGLGGCAATRQQCIDNRVNAALAGGQVYYGSAGESDYSTIASWSRCPLGFSYEAKRDSSGSMNFYCPVHGGVPRDAYLRGAGVEDVY